MLKIFKYTWGGNSWESWDYVIISKSKEDAFKLATHDISIEDIKEIPFLEGEYCIGGYIE